MQTLLIANGLMTVSLTITAITLIATTCQSLRRAAAGGDRNPCPKS